MVEGFKAPRATIQCPMCIFTVKQEEARELAINNGNLVHCENCGIVIAELVDGGIEKRNLKGLKKEVAANDGLRSLEEYQQNPIGRFYRDPDFPTPFKQELLLFFARIVHYIMKELEPKRGKIKNWTLDDDILTEIIDNANPVLHNLIRNLFLQDLTYIERDDFEDSLDYLLEKKQQDPQFREDFLIYMRWITSEVFKVRTKLWNKRELPQFEHTIQTALKKTNLQRPVIRETRWTAMNYDENGLPHTIGQKLDKALKLFETEVLPVLEEDPELKRQMEEQKFLGINDLIPRGFNGFISALTQSPDNKISWNDFKKFAGFTGSREKPREEKAMSYKFLNHDDQGNLLSRDEKIRIAEKFYNKTIIPDLLTIPSIKQKVDQGKNIVIRDLTLNGYSGFINSLSKSGNKVRWNEFREALGLDISINHEKFKFMNYDENGNRLTRDEKMKVAVNYFVNQILPDLVKDPKIKVKIDRGDAPTVIDIRKVQGGFIDPLTKRGHKIAHNELMRELGFTINIDQDKYRRINFDENGEFLSRKEKIKKAREFFIKKIIPNLLQKRIIAPGETPGVRDIIKGGYSGFYPNLAFKGERITYNEFLTEINMPLNLEQGRWDFMKYDSSGKILSSDKKIEKCVDYLLKEIYPDLINKKIIKNGETPSTFDFIDGGHWDFITAFRQKEPSIRLQDLLNTAGFQLESPQDHNKWKFLYNKKGKLYPRKKQIKLVLNYFIKEIIPDLKKRGLLPEGKAPEVDLLRKSGHYDFYKLLYRRDLSYLEIIEESDLTPNFKNTLSIIGKNFHWIAERIFLEHAKRNNCNAFYEVEKNSDNSVVVDLNFRKLSALADVFSTIKPRIKIVNCDYYLSDSYAKAIDHASRDYQGKKRALILVPLHAKKSRALNSDEKYNYNVTIMDPLRFTQFMGYKNDLKEEFLEAVELAKTAIYNDIAFETLDEKALKSRVFIKDPTNKVNHSTKQFEKVKNKYNIKY